MKNMPVIKRTKQLLNENNFSISRSRIKNLIENKQLKVDGKTVNNPSFKIQNCEIIEIKCKRSYQKWRY